MEWQITPPRSSSYERSWTSRIGPLEVNLYKLIPMPDRLPWSYSIHTRNSDSERVLVDYGDFNASDEEAARAHIRAVLVVYSRTQIDVYSTILCSLDR